MMFHFQSFPVGCRGVKPHKFICLLYYNALFYGGINASIRIPIQLQFILIKIYLIFGYKSQVVRLIQVPIKTCRLS